MKKRIFSLLTCLALVLGLLPTAAFAAGSAMPTHDAENKVIYANGTPITVEAGATNGYSSVWYMNGSEKTYLVENEDLSAYAIYGGSGTDEVDSTSVTMTGGTVWAVYGGGYSGAVSGGTEVILIGDAAMTEDGVVPSGEYPVVLNSVFGGGYSGAVDGKATVTIEGGLLDGNNYENQNDENLVYGVFGGGYTDAATVGSTEVTVDGGAIRGLWKTDSNTPSRVAIYGGGYQGAVSGKASVTVRDIRLGYNNSSNGSTNIEYVDIYGGGHTGAVNGGTNVTIGEGIDLNAGSVYGGGKGGQVSGSVTVTAEENALFAGLYGGGYQGAVRGDITLDIYGTVAGVTGGGYAAPVDGDVNINIYGTVTGGNLAAQALHGGGYTPEATVNGKAVITVREGGECSPAYLYGGSGDPTTNADGCYTTTTKSDYGIIVEKGGKLAVGTIYIDGTEADILLESGAQPIEVQNGSINGGAAGTALTIEAADAPCMVAYEKTDAFSLAVTDDFAPNNGNYEMAGEAEGSTLNADWFSKWDMTHNSTTDSALYMKGKLTADNTTVTLSATEGTLSGTGNGTPPTVTVKWRDDAATKEKTASVTKDWYVDSERDDYFEKAGTHTLTVTGTGLYTGTVTNCGTYNLNAFQPVLTLTPEVSQQAPGCAVELSYTVKDSSGDFIQRPTGGDNRYNLAFAYLTNSGGSWTEIPAPSGVYPEVKAITFEIPEDAEDGTVYQFKVTATGAGSYENAYAAAEATAKVTVSSNPYYLSGYITTKYGAMPTAKPGIYLATPNSYTNKGYTVNSPTYAAGDAIKTWPVGEYAGVEISYTVTATDVSRNNELTADTVLTGYVTLKVNPATPTFETEPAAKENLTYDDTAQELITAGTLSQPDDGSVTALYGLSGSSGEEPTEWSEEIPTATDAGTYYVWYKVESSSDNWEDVEPECIDVTIQPIALSVTADSQFIEYGATPNTEWEVGATVTVVTGSLVPGHTLTGDLQLEGDPVGAGIYTDAITIIDDTVAVKYGNVDKTDNYAITCASGELTINPKSVTPTVTLSTTSFTYDGEEKEPLVTVWDGSTEISPDEYTVTYGGNVAAGTASVTVKDIDGGNYTIQPGQGVTVSFTINKAVPTVVVSEHIAPIDGGGHTVTLTATVTGVEGATPTGAVDFKKADGTVIGSGDLDGDGVATYIWTVAAANDGAYTITAAYTGDSNYSAASDDVTFDTRKKDQETPLVVSYSGTASYGQTLTLSTTGGSGTGAVTYTITGGEYTLNGDKLTLNDIGTLTIMATKAGDNTYNPADSAPLPISVDRATPVGSASYNTFTVAGKTLDDANLTNNFKDLEGYSLTGSIRWVDADGVELDGNTALVLDQEYTWVFNPASGFFKEMTDTAKLYTAASTPTTPNDGGSDTTGGSDDDDNDSPVTVPISGEDNTIHVGATVSGDKATIKDVDLSKLDTVIGDNLNIGTVTIDFSGLKTTKPITTVEIPSNVVKEIAEAVNDPSNDAESLEIILSDGTSIEFDAEALGEKSAQASGVDITISIKTSKGTSAQSAVVGDRPAYDINVTSGGEHISDMGGMVTVHAPYELKDGELPSGIIVYYVDDNGNKEACVTSYDSVKKRVNWKTDHLSLYMIDYDEALAETCDGGEGCPSAKFIDIAPNAWYHEAIDYILENGLMNGYGNGYFGPGDNLSRGMLAQILYNLEGRPAVTGEIPFTDVAEGKYYVDAIKWAQQNGIVSGYGGGLFGPDDNITREQLAVMLWRYAGSPAATSKELNFTDADEAGTWAVDALIWAQENGVMQGDNGTVNPKGNATRAHVAQMLKNFLENIIK